MNQPPTVELTTNPVLVGVEESRRQQEIAAVQQTQRSFRHRLVRLEHNNGEPIRYVTPKPTRSQLKRHWKQQRRRLGRKP